MIKKYPLSLLTALVIIVLSLIPIPEVPELEQVPLYDKWTHMVMYGTLSLIIWWEYCRQHTRLDVFRLTIGAIVLPALMSGLLELGQEYLTTCRSGDWFDFLANCIGVALAALIAIVTLTIRRRKA